MPDIDHEIKIDGPPERVFAALTTLDGVARWHTPGSRGSGEVGSVWVFSYAGHPEFHWGIVTSDAATRVVWRCTQGPGDSVGTTEILQQFNGQSYKVVYRAFSNLRHRLGRCDDPPWYRYTFSDTDFAVPVEASEPCDFDPRHRE